MGCGFSPSGCSDFEFYKTLIIVAAVLALPLIILYFLEKKNLQKEFLAVSVITIILYSVPIISFGYYNIGIFAPQSVDSCDMAGDHKNECLSNVALDNRDTKICLLINTSGMRNSCYWKIAYETKTLKPCSLIEDKNMTEDCKRIVIN